MTRPDQHRASPHDPDADRLSATWNDLVAGRQPVESDELTDAVQSLHAAAPTYRPTSTFRDELREQLMHTAMPIEMPGVRQQPRLREQTAEPRLRVPTVLGGHAVRWTAIAATIALLLTTLAAGYLGGLLPAGNGSGPTRNVAAPYLVNGTPVAGTPVSGTPVANVCDTVGRYLPCGPNPEIGPGMFDPSRLPAEALDVTKAQLQGWEVEGSGTVTFSAPHNPVTGVAVDVVVMGAYRAKFSAPVTVYRAYPGSGGVWLYPEAGAQIELSRGDSVSYQIGTKTELENPFNAWTLKFKTALFYDGDPSPGNFGAAGNVQVRIDGDGTLPKPLAELGAPEISVEISYATLPEVGAPISGTTFLTPVIGPVASTQVLGGPNEGFVVWVSTNAPRG
ncbi:MAG TPA: hypothetical protein VFI12_04605 [Thermomicrobiales bacterium]|nr:hypothetical protein [Thermomicrobiales bacterium]